MKISELKEKVGDRDFLMNGFLSKDIGVEIRKYRSIAVKKLIIDDILENCIKYNENGMAIIDFVFKQINFDIALVSNYTNLEINEEDFIGDYDYLHESKIIHCIKNEIKGEVEALSKLLENEIEQRLELENSVSGVVNRFLEKVLDKIPSDNGLQKLLKNFSKEFKDFDIDKLGVIQDMYKMVTDQGELSDG